MAVSIDTKYVTFVLLSHAAFVADEIWGVMLEVARSRRVSVHISRARPPSVRRQTALLREHPSVKR